MKLRNALCALAIGVVALGGCTSATVDGPTTGSLTANPDARAAAIWANRTAYAGDNSKVIALADVAGFGERGTYSLTLWTTRKPYAVTITLMDSAKPFADTDFSAPATIMLGSVTNLDSVRVTSGSESYTLTAQEATARLGHDVKTLGRDRAGLEDYVRSLAD
jgi:hypothetical protein